MQAALALAGRGLFTTDPNPRVGCLLVRAGEVVGQGWHERSGGPHAEVVALEQAGDAAAGSTCYVTLEPCSHTGQTPPCADTLIRAGVERVVVAVEDPDPRVAGSGIRRLAEAGLEVQSGVLEEAARELNIGFFSRHQRQRPWVRLKMAQSLDGRTALADGESQWITGQQARADGHRWRARSAALLTGIGTILADDPGLDVRLDAAVTQPIRCILDSQWRTPPAAVTLDRPGRVLVFGSESMEPGRGLQDSGAELIAIPKTARGLDLGAVMRRLNSEAVNELHVESGPVLAGSLVAGGWVDELLIYLAPAILGHSGRPGFVTPQLESLAHRYQFDTISVDSIGPDLRWRLRRKAGPLDP